MAKVLQTTLQIAESNVEQYCTADGLSLNTGGYAIRLYLNGHTQGSAILNNAAKEVLYPSATAHPFKIDSFIRANKSGGSMTISLQFNGTSVQSETGDWGSGLKNKIKEGIADPVVINSNRSAEIKWHIKGSSTVSRFSIASTKLTFYFNQYEMRPLVGNNVNGIQKVTVSNASPCYGDTVVFTPKLVQGATWFGWYSDAACTNLVSADQNYSVSPSSDITLYAKATIDATLYNVSAIAGAEITSVNVSDSIVPEGSTATFTAQVNTGCSFEAWYSDDTYTTIVSTENPYTATITANTTLYAKAHRSSLNMSVGSAEHGTASVSATTVPYGSDVTFTFTPEDETWELYGWYSDSGFTQLVSEANPYTFTATEDAALYPKVGVKRYTITLKRNHYIVSTTTYYLTIASLYEDQLTDMEREYIKTGEFSKIDQAKIFDITTAQGNDGNKAITATLKAPMNLLCVIYSAIQNTSDEYLTALALNQDPTLTTSIVDRGNDPSVICPWNYYMFYPSATNTYYVIKGLNCDCFAIAKDGITKATVPTHVMQNTKAPFSAELSPGYTFAGWYSNDACTKLVSTDNPAHITCPVYTTEDQSSTSLTLYAKATKAIYTIGVGTAEHGSATVSKSTAYYGDTVTFNCTVDEGYEFNGWYSDERLTQLVSESAEYVHSVTGDITLYPKVVPIKSSLLLHPTGYDEINILEGTEIEGIERIYINDESAADKDSAQITIPHSKIDNPISLGFYIDGSKFTNIPNNAIITDITISSTLNYNTLLDKSYITEFCTAKRIYTNGTVSYTRIGENKYKNTKVSTKKTYSLTKDSIGSWSPEELKNGQFGIIFSAYSSSTSSTYDKIIIHNINILVTYTMPENEQVFYTVNAVPMDHCTTTVNATIAQYGDNVIFKCVVDQGYEFKGWYSNKELTQFVSKDAEYTHNITGNVILWPKIEIANNNFIIHPTGYNAINFKSSTKIENIECLYENDSNSSTDCSANWFINGEQDGNTSTNPASLAFYVAGEKFINIPDNAQIIDLNVLIRMGGTLAASQGALAKLHEIYTAQRSIENGETSYNQIGIKKYTDKSNIPETEINSYTLTNAEVGNWTPAALKAGKFSIVLSASFGKKGLFKIATPDIYNIDIFVSYALPTTGFSFKSNGTWKNALAVFKKTNGAWVQQSNPASLFTGSPSGTESNYLYLGE